MADDKYHGTSTQSMCKFASFHLGGGGGGMQAGYFIVIAVPVYSGNQPLVENYIIS